MMAVLIPPVFSENSCSDAERKVFEYLRNDPATGDWLVLHSLGLSQNRPRPYGEIDFVLIIPRQGIVCLEVKGGGVSCRDGEWFTTNRHGQTDKLKRSPFDQAKSSMFMLREKIHTNFAGNRDILNTPTGYMVLFPDCITPPVSPEFIREEVADITDLQGPISQVIKKYSKTVLNRRQRDPNRFLPDTSAIKELRRFLRPDFDCPISLVSQILSAEKKITEFTSEQLERLEDFEDNPRCLFQGAAGTGKTLLAIEFANRAAKQGNSVLLVCFNKLLGQWLSTQTHGVTCGSFYSLLRQTILKSYLKDEFLALESEGTGTEKYEEMFPVYGRSAIEDLEQHFDVLVIDEAQDLFNEARLSVCNDWLKNALSNGNWAIFGDFTGQQLYQNKLTARHEIDQLCSSYTVGKLWHNCRNTRNIAEAAASAANFEKFPYRNQMVEGPAVSYFYWKRRDEQLNELESIVESLLNDGVPAGDMAILGPYTYDNSCLSGSRLIAGKRVKVIDSIKDLEKNDDCLRYATVWSYKGLEAPAVFVIDFDSAKFNEFSDLLYVAVSRARTYLKVLASTDLRKIIQGNPAARKPSPS